MKVFSKIVHIFRFISVLHFISHFCLSKRISGLIDFVSNFGLETKIKNAKKENRLFRPENVLCKKIQLGAVLGTSHTSKISSKVFRANFLILEPYIKNFYETNQMNVKKCKTINNLLMFNFQKLHILLWNFM